ncbi:MAG TPA: hypothetical protein VJV39_03690 [Dongiaceae bacterium]|nr:hypothetical protein [Dongiaceae bacterium]
MFLFDLFETRSVPSSRAAVGSKGGSGKSADVDIGLERFTSLPRTVPAEISAAGLATSDLSQ